MVVAGVVNRDEIGLPEAVERLPELCFIEVVGGGEVVEPQTGVAVKASEEPGLSGSEVDLGPGGEPFEDSCRLLAAGEDAELAGELVDGVDGLRDGKGFADAGGGDGVRSGSSLMNQVSTNAATPIAAATRKTTLSESVKACTYASCTGGGSCCSVAGLNGRPRPGVGRGRLRRGCA